MKNIRWVVETVDKGQMLRRLTLCYKMWVLRVLIKIAARSEMSFLGDSSLQTNFLPQFWISYRSSLVILQYLIYVSSDSDLMGLDC